MWPRRKIIKRSLYCAVFCLLSSLSFADDKGYFYSNKERNPFYPLVDSYGKILIPKKINIANISLEGIIYSKKNPVVAINGEILEEGERIGEYTIVKIEEKKVILKKGNKKYSLKLEVEND
ncbi:MAG: general secretion pathway protein GspB [Candidatus Omnitrophica bacterium]|nr:general secretion pathway protein GspB [Candidatus Omnitrophota bacterium]MCF7877405.1 general secretion pathway protein GspB [Candidatus Omnitrophota bacterium]MCF7878626.1 general secretion pathway protein GspB [Candidatus Omnitrophota bacterium]MCF7892644.1 general secretion pathway protein GspB [Candidatus Omnitrophota bacterium]